MVFKIIQDLLHHILLVRGFEGVSVHWLLGLALIPHDKDQQLHQISLQHVISALSPGGLLRLHGGTDLEDSLPQLPLRVNDVAAVRHGDMIRADSRKSHVGKADKKLRGRGLNLFQKESLMPYSRIEDHQIPLLDVIDLSLDMIFPFSRQHKSHFQMIMAMIYSLVLVSGTLPDIQEGRIHFFDHHRSLFVHISPKPHSKSHCEKTPAPYKPVPPFIGPIPPSPP